MSIIFDALKKVQKKTAKQEISMPSGPETTKPSFKFRPKVILLYFVVAAAGFLIGKVIYDFILPKSKKPLLSRAAPLPEPTQQAAGLKEKTASAPAEQPKPVKKDIKSSPVVNGIFFSKDVGYCLINNRIAKEGDTVEGVTVKRINPDYVEAEIGGNTVKLRSPSR